MDKTQSGPGALADFGCHMLDLAGWLTGELCGEVHPLAAACNTVIPERQSLSGDGLQPVTNDDCAVFMARSDSGTLYTFTASRVGIWDHSIEIVGEKGMLRADLSAGNGVQVWLREAGGAYLPENRKVLDISNEQGHTGILNTFAACIPARWPMAAACRQPWTGWIRTPCKQQILHFCLNILFAPSLLFCTKSSGCNSRGFL